LRTGICRDCGAEFVAAARGVINARCPSCREVRSLCAACGGERPAGHVGRYCSPTCRPTCAVCSRVATKNGYCDSHNFMQRKHGDPLGGRYTWAAEARCLVCGLDRDDLGDAWTSKNRRWCTAKHERIWYRYDGNVPEGFTCEGCSAWVLYQEPGKKRLRDDTRQCRECAFETRYELTAWQLAERDGNTCRICLSAVDLSLSYPDLMSASADHIVPRSRGGGHDAANLQLAHWICNVRRQDRPLEEVVAIHG
jgi:5-methylcytosine-specific restriction endonuclease McrA